MKVSIWQQFSSNHSSYFLVVGRFANVDDAADNGHQLRDWLYRMMWGMIHFRSNLRVGLTPPAGDLTTHRAHKIFYP